MLWQSSARDIICIGQVRPTSWRRELLVSGISSPDEQLCRKIREAAKRTLHLDATSIVYGKHYYKLANGIVSWVPEQGTNLITIDLRNCSMDTKKADITAKIAN